MAISDDELIERVRNSNNRRDRLLLQLIEEVARVRHAIIWRNSTAPEAYDRNSSKKSYP